MNYDVAVLGAGPGGYVAAIRCAQYGLKTALVEAGELGGTCLNRGCIPTKALLECAHQYEQVLKAGSFGVSVKDVSFDYAKMVSFKDKTVLRLRKGVESLEKAHGVSIIKGFGRLSGSHTIVAGAAEIIADNIIIATGSSPARPPIKGIEHSLSSDGVLAMDQLPKSLVIIGGGVIGMEFASLFAALGCGVTVLEMLPEILPGMDKEIREMLQKSLVKKGVQIVTSARVISIDKTGDTTVTYETGGKTLQAMAECCAVCTGRTPNTSDIGLENAGVKASGRFIAVDEFLCTNIPHIYAIGDITGKQQLAHLASAQGLAAAAAIAGKPSAMRYDIVPTCVYTNPEIAGVGMNQEQAEKAGYKVAVGRFAVPANGKAMILGAQEGLIKLISDARTGEILGGQILSPHATDMISEIASAMQNEGTIEELAATIHPHPTVSEIIMEAAHDSEGFCVHAPPKAALAAP